MQLSHRFIILWVLRYIILWKVKKCFARFFVAGCGNEQAEITRGVFGIELNPVDKCKTKDLVKR